MFCRALLEGLVWCGGRWSSCWRLGEGQLGECLLQGRGNGFVF